MTSFEKVCLSALLLGTTCMACHPRVVNYSGMPRATVGFTYCDPTTGLIRSALDAELFLVDSVGDVQALTTLPEILVHEAVHRSQLEARRTSPNKCPGDFSWLELVDAEIAGYCAGYAVALARGAYPVEVGRRYALAFIRQFQPVFLFASAVVQYVGPRWDAACPGKPLNWPP
jgi:hypothetical protein